MVFLIHFGAVLCATSLSRVAPAINDHLRLSPVDQMIPDASIAHALPSWAYQQNTLDSFYKQKNYRICL